jgi:putative toxin-antitoxin system antitoxin component (TIGR02293 family)
MSAIWRYHECHMSHRVPGGPRAAVTAQMIAETLGGPKVLRGRTRTVEDLRDRLRAGLPYAALASVASRFALGREALGAVLHLPPRTLARRKREKRLTPDESDRLVRLTRVAALTEDVLGSRERATRWLHEANAALGGAAPLRQLDTDPGARQVEDLLLRIAHGVYS